MESKILTLLLFLITNSIMYRKKQINQSYRINFIET